MLKWPVIISVLAFLPLLSALTVVPKQLTDKQQSVKPAKTHSEATPAISPAKPLSPSDFISLLEKKGEANVVTSDVTVRVKNNGDTYEVYVEKKDQDNPTESAVIDTTLTKEQLYAILSQLPQ